MFGAICGDIIGSVFEGDAPMDENFMFFTTSAEFTDDTVLTCAIADSLLSGPPYLYGESIKKFAKSYPDAGYGAMFMTWMLSESATAYFSFGNGSAMRASPIAWTFNTEKDVLFEAAKSAIVTHNHPEGVRGAQAIAIAVFFARTGKSKDFIRDWISRKLSYDLSKSIDDIIADTTLRFNAFSMTTVPQAITAFLDTENYEECIRKSIMIGGDTDTIACMAGSIAEAYYGGVDEAIIRKASKLLSSELLSIIRDFYKKYQVDYLSYGGFINGL